MKIVVEKESQRIIGGQIITGEEVNQRVNALSFAIQKQMTVRELAKADTAYAPPLNETWEPHGFSSRNDIKKTIIDNLQNLTTILSSLQDL